MLNSSVKQKVVEFSEGPYKAVVYEVANENPPYLTEWIDRDSGKSPSSLDINFRNLKLDRLRERLFAWMAKHNDTP